MTVLLNRPYGAYPAGAIVELPASTEAAIVAQNIGQVSVATPTSGPITSNEIQGVAVIPAGSLSVTVTNPNVNISTKINAYVSQAAGDTTLPAILRVVAANGSFTIYGAANATAAVVCRWFLEASGLTPNQ